MNFLSKLNRKQYILISIAVLVFSVLLLFWFTSFFNGRKEALILENEKEAEEILEVEEFSSVSGSIMDIIGKNKLIIEPSEKFLLQFPDMPQNITATVEQGTVIAEVIQKKPEEYREDMEAYREFLLSILKEHGMSIQDFKYESSDIPGSPGPEPPWPYRINIVNLSELSVGDRITVQVKGYSIDKENFEADVILREINQK